MPRDEYRGNRGDLIDLGCCRRFLDLAAELTLETFKYRFVPPFHSSVCWQMALGGRQSTGLDAQDPANALNIAD
jgi:hypothetical protein